MSNHNHTPGPWEKGKVSDSVVSKDMATMQKAQQRWEYEVTTYGGGLVAESIAPCDIALISAAPDLLVACEALVEFIGTDKLDDETVHWWYGDTGPSLKKAHAAINKAYGREVYRE